MRAVRIKNIGGAFIDTIEPPPASLFSFSCLYYNYIKNFAKNQLKSPKT